MALIDEGKKAPAFTLKDQSGTPHSLSDYAGQPVVLYFYPKDDTPGCTTESCDFQARLPQFKKSKAVVLGMSILDEKSKAKLPASTASRSRSWPTRSTRSLKNTVYGSRRCATGVNTWESSAPPISSAPTAK